MNTKPNPKDYPPQSPHDLEWGGVNQKYYSDLNQWERMNNQQGKQIPIEEKYEDALPNTQQDLKIYQTAGYDAEQVKAIRELMEEEAIEVLKFSKEQLLKEAESNNGFISHIPVYVMYERFKQSKQSK